MPLNEIEVRALCDYSSEAPFMPPVPEGCPPEFRRKIAEVRAKRLGGVPEMRGGVQQVVPVAANDDARLQRFAELRA